MSGIGGRDVGPEAKRERLLDAAERVFCRLGHSGTTIGAIAGGAGVTRPTVYAYFASKDDVFRSLAHRVRGELLALQEQVDTSSPEATVRATLTAYLQVHARHHGMLTLIAHQALSDPAMRALHDEVFSRVERRHARFLERLVRRGLAEPAVPPAVLAEAVTGLVARFAGDDDPARYADHLVALYLRMAGLGPSGSPTSRT